MAVCCCAKICVMNIIFFLFMLAALFCEGATDLSEGQDVKTLKTFFPASCRSVKNLESSWVVVSALHELVPFSFLQNLKEQVEPVEKDFYATLVMFEGMRRALDKCFLVKMANIEDVVESAIIPEDEGACYMYMLNIFADMCRSVSQQRVTDLKRMLGLLKNIFLGKMFAKDCCI